MSYISQASLVDDVQLRRRVVACASISGVDNANSWAHQNRWRFATQPGWESAYETAVRDNKPKPGEDQTVISDAMILAAVQALQSES